MLNGPKSWCCSALRIRALIRICWIQNNRFINGRLVNNSNVSKSTLTVFPMTEEIISFLSKSYERKNEHFLSSQWNSAAANCSSLVLKFLPPLWLRVDPENLGGDSQHLGPGRWSMLINSVRCSGRLIAQLPLQETTAYRVKATARNQSGNTFNQLITRNNYSLTPQWHTV